MSPGTRLREQLNLVGEAKARSSSADIAAHLALSPGQRLERVARQSSALVSLSRQAGKASGAHDDRETWVRVFRHLQRTAHDG
jgi:hypothetical protein